ncbi:MAG: ATP-binding protein [Thermoplasmata archaeon]|nr:ATP-binding protein [Thermoplasmata archaeon]
MSDPLHDPGAILAQAPVGIAVIEAPGRIRYANPAYFETSGRDSTIIGRDVHELGEEEGSLAPTVRDAIDRALTDGSPSTFRSIRARHRSRPGGVYLDIDVRALVPTADGVARAVVVLHDATERVEEHRQVHLFYSSFLTSTNAIEITDAAGILVDVNPAFERIYGYSRAECVGRKPNLVRGRNSPPEFFARMWADLLDPERGYWSGELQNRDRKGRERPVFLTITAIKDDAGVTTHYLGVAVDLLEQKAWERVAGHAERLASVGQLAAGVAHEINTPLANVMLATESLRRKLDDPWTRGRLDTISSQVEVAAKIVRGLLDFARRSEPQMVRLDLREVAGQAVEFLRGKQSENVEFVVHVPGEVVLVFGDRGQLMQVVMNLLNNACDAVQGKGRVLLEVRRQGDDAEVEVLDSGPGISSDALPHIFEPFYTTKAEGQGTGLGLAICHGIVQTHHGSILARNGPEGGASFLVVLPLAATDHPAPT